MAKVEQNEINLYTKQQAFVECQKPIRGFTAGVGSGKSISGAIDMLLRSKPGCLYMVCSPSYGMLNDATLRTFKEYACKMGVWDDRGFVQTPRPHLKGKNGAEYLFRSMDDADCYDEQTEILTRAGWKFFRDLDGTEDVFTLNRDGMAEWQRPMRYIREWYTGSMFSVRSGKLDLLVTPRHRFLVQQPYSNKRVFRTLGEMAGGDKIPAHCDFAGTDNLAITDDHCALMGMYLAEGTAYGNHGGDISKRKGNYSVFFSQTAGNKGGTKGDVRSQFEEILCRLGYHFRRRHNKTIGADDGLEILHKELWASLIVLGNKYTKFIPDDYKELPQAKLRVLLHWLLMGDGTIRGGDGLLKKNGRPQPLQRVYYTVSKQLADDVQEIAIKAGYSAIIRIKPPAKVPGKIHGREVISRVPLYAVSICHNKYNYLRDSEESYVSRTTYDGPIYCVEVPNHVVMVRRNGRICWCGNSLRGPNASGIWMDEVQKTSEEAYTILLGRLRQHGKRGWLTATFTPNTPDHWTSKTFIEDHIERTIVMETEEGPKEITYLESKDGDGATFRASLKENIYLDPAFYEGLRRAYAASPLRIERELEGRCVYLEGTEWLPEYFEDCMFDEWPDPSRGGIRVLALDSSKGKGGKTGDYSAFVKVLWVDGLLYVDADMRNDRDASVISSTGVELFCDWQPHYFVVEEEMGQDLLIADMHRIADERGILMPITPMGTDKINKEVRIRRLTPYVSHRQFRFKSNSPGMKIGLEQMRGFPLAEHDDFEDALEYSIRLLVKATTGQVLPPRSCTYTPMGSVM